MVLASPSLKTRALRWLAQREYSRAELQRKLQRHLQEGDDLDELLDDLERKDFINAERVAASLVHQRGAAWGGQRVALELRRKGLDADLVRATAADLAASELQRAQALWRRRFAGAAPATPQERARHMRFLTARGYAFDVVRQVVPIVGGVEPEL